jgi:hypothetical protein
VALGDKSTLWEEFKALSKEEKKVCAQQTRAAPHLAAPPPLPCPGGCSDVSSLPSGRQDAGACASCDTAEAFLLAGCFVRAQTRWCVCVFMHSRTRIWPRQPTRTFAQWVVCVHVCVSVCE